MKALMEVREPVVFGLEGRHRVDMYDRATGRYLGSKHGHNAVTTTGKNLFLDILIGVSTSRLTQASSQLHIFAGAGGTAVKTITAAAAAPNHGTARQVSWTWNDLTADTYAANRLEVRQGASTIFSDSTPNFGTKPTTQNWIYTYTLTITGPATFDDGVGGYPGLNNMLRMLSGALTQAYTAGTNLQMRARTSTSTILGTANSSSVSRTNQTVTWVFSVPAGSITGDWYNIEIFSAVDGTHTLRRWNDALGNKSASTTRTYNYSFSV